MLVGTEPGLLLEWQAYFELEPFGEERADLRNAIACQTIAQAMGMKKKGGADFDISDFMPNFEKEPDKSAGRKGIDPLAAQALMKRYYGNNSKPGGKPNSENR